jgi:DNA-binding transcriptional ArsR family regulator
LKPITDIDDPRLVKGLAHPLRIHILRVLEGRVASPSEIAEEIDAPLGNVSYHVRFLARVGLIELASTKPRRGAVEHYYRAVGRPQISDRAWDAVPKVVKNALVGSALDEAGTMITSAARSGGFEVDQAQVSRDSFTVDEQGLTELAAALGDLRGRAEKIEQQSRKRLAGAEDGATSVDAGLVMMLFEGGRPGSDGTPGPRRRRSSSARR